MVHDPNRTPIDLAAVRKMREAAAQHERERGEWKSVVAQDLRHMNVPLMHRPHAALVALELGDYELVADRIEDIEREMALLTELPIPQQEFLYFVNELRIRMLQVPTKDLPAPIRNWIRDMPARLDALIKRVKALPDAPDSEAHDESAAGPAAEAVAAQIQAITNMVRGLDEGQVLRVSQQQALDRALRLVFLREAGSVDAEVQMGITIAAMRQLQPLFIRHPEEMRNYLTHVLDAEQQVFTLMPDETHWSALRDEVHGTLMEGLTSEEQVDTLASVLSVINEECMRRAELSRDAADNAKGKKLAEQLDRLGLIWEELLVAADERGQRHEAYEAAQLPFTAFSLREPVAPGRFPGLFALRALSTEPVPANKLAFLIHWYEKEVRNAVYGENLDTLAHIGAYAQECADAGDEEVKHRAQELIAQIRATIEKHKAGYEEEAHQAEIRLLALTGALNPAQTLQKDDWEFLSQLARNARSVPLMRTARTLLRISEPHLDALSPHPDVPWSSVLDFYERAALLTR